MNYGGIRFFSGMEHLWDDKARELREAIARTREAYTRASEACAALMKDIPSGLPGSDGAQRIINTAKAERHALNEYMESDARVQ